ncbi:MAG: hypothetical protein N2C13_00505 [Chloroflexota bacterium]
MNNKYDENVEEYVEISRSTVRWFMFIVLFTFIVTALTFYFAFGISNFQVSVLRIFAIAGLVLTILGTARVFRQELGSGLNLLVTGLLLALIAPAIFVQGLGFLTLLLIIPLLAFTLNPTSASSNSGKYIIIGFVLGVAALIFDIFIGDANFRYMVAQVMQPYLTGATVLLILLNGFYIVSEFSTTSSRVKLEKIFQVENIRTRLVIAFLAVTIIPLVLLAIINNRLVQTTLIENANQSLFGIASEVGSSVDDFILNTPPIILGEAQLPAFSEYLSLPSRLQSQADQKNPVRAILEDLKRKDVERIISYALLDRKGINVVDSIPINNGTDESKSEYFQASYNDGIAYATDVIFVTDNVGGDSSKIPSIFFSAPIIASNGETVGVLRVQYSAFITLQNIARRSNNLAGEESFGVFFQEVEGR